MEGNISRRALLGLTAAAASQILENHAPIKIFSDDVLPAIGMEEMAVDTETLPEPTQGLNYEPPLPEIIFKSAHVTVAEENQKEGDGGWVLMQPNTSYVAAFTAPHSAKPGEKLSFHVASNDGRYDLKLYRLGWYGGAGGRLVYEKDGISAPQQTTKYDPTTAGTTGTWEASHEVVVPDEWRSGMYAAVATSTNKFQSLAPFWVRSPKPNAPIVAESGLLTAQAYNNINGLSLYGGASAVSLDRQFRDCWGAGDIFRYELPFVRFAEKAGIDMDYQADLDTQNDEEALMGRVLIAMVGHHEYYTMDMKRRLEQAVKNGTNVALFGSNACYWRINLEDTIFGKNRKVVCDRKTMASPNKPKSQFRNQEEHEAALFGVAYEQTSKGDDWVVANENHWVFKDSGFKNGDAITHGIGPEFDTIFDGVPAGVGREILAASVVNKGPGQGHSYSCLTTHESGAQVFATGSLEWAQALDSFRIGIRSYPIPTEDPRAQILAANVLKTLG